MANTQERQFVEGKLLYRTHTTGQLENGSGRMKKAQATLEKAGWEGFLEAVAHKGFSLGKRKFFPVEYVNPCNTSFLLREAFEKERHIHMFL